MSQQGIDTQDLGVGLSILSDIFNAQGEKAFVEQNVLWRTPSRASLISSPASMALDVSRSSADALLRKTGRASSQFVTRAETGWCCLHHMLRDKSYSENSLQRQFRQTLERGRKRLTVKHLRLGDLVSGVPEVIEKARTRTGRSGKIQREQWERVCCEIDAREDYESIGCYEASKLLGVCVFWRYQYHYRSIINAVDPKAFSLGVSNLLVFESLRFLIQKPECQVVSLGRTGIPERVGVSRFKRHAGMEAVPIRVAVLLHPRLRWISRSTWLIGVLQSMQRRSAFARRFENQIATLVAAQATRPEMLSD